MLTVDGVYWALTFKTTGTFASTFIKGPFTFGQGNEGSIFIDGAIKSVLVKPAQIGDILIPIDSEAVVFLDGSMQVESTQPITIGDFTLTEGYTIYIAADGLISGVLAQDVKEEQRHYEKGGRIYLTQEGKVKKYHK